MQLAILLLLAFTPCPDGVACDDAHKCDWISPTVSRLGNERLRWASADRVEWYEVACEAGTQTTVLGQSANVSAFIAEGCTAFRVRACNQYGCGGWSEPVWFVPWSCFRSGCVEPCFAGGPIRYPSLEQCHD